MAVLKKGGVLAASLPDDEESLTGDSRRAKSDLTATFRNVRYGGKSPVPAAHPVAEPQAPACYPGPGSNLGAEVSLPVLLEDEDQLQWRYLGAEFNLGANTGAEPWAT